MVGVEKGEGGDEEAGVTEGSLVVVEEGEEAAAEVFEGRIEYMVAAVMAAPPPALRAAMIAIDAFDIAGVERVVKQIRNSKTRLIPKIGDKVCRAVT